MLTLRIHRVWGSVQSELGRLGRHRAIAHPRTDLPLSQVAFHVCRMGFIHPQTSWSSINFHEIPCSKLRISHRFVWVFVPHPKKKRPSLKTKHLTLLPCHRCHSTLSVTRSPSWTGLVKWVKHRATRRFHRANGSMMFNADAPTCGAQAA
jgi:hypothetical protein